MSVRLNGPSEKLGDTKLSNSFASFEIGEPTRKRDEFFRHIGKRSLVLDSAKYFMLPEEGLHASFIEKEDFGLGREDSRHVVRFGQLILNGPGVHESPDFVAVKPFEDRRELYTEWAANTYVNEVFDDQRAFLPLGILKGKHGEASLITLYEHGVKTADTIFWADRYAQPEALRANVVEKAAATAMYSLGLLHGARLIHGDAQAKNLGWDNRHARFIDLEGSTLIPDEAADTPEFTDKLLNDVELFIQSTTQVEENQEPISDALRSPRIATKLLGGYRTGMQKARLRQTNQALPDYATLHEEPIRDTIKRTYR